MVIWMLSARKPGHPRASPFFLTITEIFQITLLLLKAREYIRERLRILITMVMSILLEKTPIPTNHIRGITKTCCCLTKKDCPSSVTMGHAVFRNRPGYMDIAGGYVTL